MKKSTVGLLVTGAVIVVSIGLATWASLPTPPVKDSSFALARSTVSASSTPLFLSTTQTPADTLPWNVPNVRASSTRFQGAVDGTKVYLAVDTYGSIEIICGRGDNYSYGSGGGGNRVEARGLPDGRMVQYIPQGATDQTLKGYVRLSQYMIIERGRGHS